MLRKSKIVEFLLYGACFFSCLSQLPYFIDSGMTQAVSFPMWLLTFFILILKCKWKINRSVLVMATPAFVFLVLMLVASMFNSDAVYITSSLFYSFLISMFIFFVGNMSGPYCSEKIIKRIYIFYILSTFIVSVVVFIQYFGFGYDLTSRIYGFASKNSFAQIVFTAIILLLVKLKPTRFIPMIAKYSMIAFEILLMAYLRSRATLVSFFFAIIILVISRNTKRSLKVLITITCGVLIILLLTNNTLNRMIFDNILFAGRDSSNLDDLASGRISIFKTFPDQIKNNWIWGIGSTYFECFYLSAILQFGIFAGGILIFIPLILVYYGIILSRSSENWYILLIITVGYLVNGIFEGLTPFGAGIKCFFMWFLFGILISRRHYVEEDGEKIGIEKL